MLTQHLRTANAIIQNPKKLIAVLNQNDTQAMRGIISCFQFLEGEGQLTNIFTASEVGRILFALAKEKNLLEMMLVLADGIVTHKNIDQLMVEAVLSNNLPLLQILIGKGGNVNATHSEGSTLLHLAIKTNALAIMEYLLRADANPHRFNQQNQSAVEYAFTDSTDLKSVMLIFIKNGVHLSLGLGQSMMRLLARNPYVQWCDHLQQCLNPIKNYVLEENVGWLYQKDYQLLFQVYENMLQGFFPISENQLESMTEQLFILIKDKQHREMLNYIIGHYYFVNANPNHLSDYQEYMLNAAFFLAQSKKDQHRERLLLRALHGLMEGPTGKFITDADELEAGNVSLENDFLNQTYEYPDLHFCLLHALAAYPSTKLFSKFIAIKTVDINLTSPTHATAYSIALGNSDKEKIQVLRNHPDLKITNKFLKSIYKYFLNDLLNTHLPYKMRMALNNIPELLTQSFHTVKGKKILIPFHALRIRNSVLFGLLLELPHFSYAIKNAEGDNLLCVALKYCQTSHINTLIENCDINAKNHMGLTPLLLAMRRKYFPIVDQLLEKPEIDLFIINPAGEMAFQYARKMCEFKLADKILRLMKKASPQKYQLAVQASENMFSLASFIDALSRKASSYQLSAKKEKKEKGKIMLQVLQDAKKYIKTMLHSEYDISRLRQLLLDFPHASGSIRENLFSNATDQKYVGLHFFRPVKIIDKVAIQAPKLLRRV